MLKLNAGDRADEVRLDERRRVPVDVVEEGERERAGEAVMPMAASEVAVAAFASNREQGARAPGRR